MELKYENAILIFFTGEYDPATGSSLSEPDAHVYDGLGQGMGKTVLTTRNIGVLKIRKSLIYEYYQNFFHRTFDPKKTYRVPRRKMVIPLDDFNDPEGKKFPFSTDPQNYGVRWLTNYKDADDGCVTRLKTQYLRDDRRIFFAFFCGKPCPWAEQYALWNYRTTIFRILVVYHECRSRRYEHDHDGPILPSSARGRPRRRIKLPRGQGIKLRRRLQHVLSYVSKSKCRGCRRVKCQSITIKLPRARGSRVVTSIIRKSIGLLFLPPRSE